MRHYLYHNYEKMDLATQPSGSDNGIHASASPVEAAYEIGRVWLSKEFPLEETSMWRRAKELGVSNKNIEIFLTNGGP